jgi:hypothetical protein
LNYELDTYLDALQGFPENADILQVARGTATLIKKDIFKNLMWYVLPQSNKQYPLTIERVRKIKAMNMQGTVPEELEAVEVVSTKPKEVEPEFVDVVGHISLRSLEKADKKRRDKGREQRQQPPQKGGNRQLPAGNAPAKQGLPVQKKGLGQQQPQRQQQQGGAQPQQRQQQGQQAKPGNVQQRGGQQQQQQPKQQGGGGQRPQGARPQQQRKPQGGTNDGTNPNNQKEDKTGV